VEEAVFDLVRASGDGTKRTLRLAHRVADPPDARPRDQTVRHSGDVRGVILGIVGAFEKHWSRRLPDAPARRFERTSRCHTAAMPPGFGRELPGTGRHQRDSRFAGDIERLAVK
jgi:hypothetical protein